MCIAHDRTADADRQSRRRPMEVAFGYSRRIEADRDESGSPRIPAKLARYGNRHPRWLLMAHLRCARTFCECRRIGNGGWPVGTLASSQYAYSAYTRSTEPPHGP